MVKISLLGITHIDIESQVRVANYIKEKKPDAVCLEIDEYRLERLLENENELNNSEDINSKETDEQATNSHELESEIFEFVDDLSPILGDIGFFEKKLAGVVDSSHAGKEMLIAYQSAKEIGAEIYLIDQSIHDISKVMDDEVSHDEAQNFQSLIDELILERKVVAKPIDHSGNNNLKEKITNNLEISDDEEINLNEVLEIFKDHDALGEILTIFRLNFPKLYAILLEDRNIYMTKEIIKILPNHKHIVVVLGYGHQHDVFNQLKGINNKLDIEIIN